MAKVVIADNAIPIARLPRDPRLDTRPDAGRWPIGDRTAQDLVHPSSAHGRRGEPLTGTRKRPLRPEE